MSSEKPLANIKTAHRLLVEELARKDTDSFDYKKLASEISRTLSLTQGPFVYAICGGWGSGKSSLLKFLMEEVVKNENVPALVYFNAWTSLIHQDLLAALVYQIDAQLRQHAGVREQMKKGTFDREKLKKCLGMLLAGGVRAANGLTPLTTIFADVFSNAVGQLKEDPFNILQAETMVRDGFDQLSAAVSRAGVSAYVFIDELDRCPPGGAVQVIEAIKMVLSGPDELSALARRLAVAGDTKVTPPEVPFKYILAIDEDYITRAFSQQYGLNSHEAYLYSAKFVQFRYHFPNKNWVPFLQPILTGLREKQYAFPDGTAECLGRILDKFGVENPRNARHILAYLATWHDHYYMQYGILTAVSKSTSVVETNARLIALAGYLGVYASVKVLHPEFVNALIRRQIFLKLIGEDYRKRTLCSVLSDASNQTSGGCLDQEEPDDVQLDAQLATQQNDLQSCLVLLLAGLNAVDEYASELMETKSLNWAESRRVIQDCFVQIFSG